MTPSSKRKLWAALYKCTRNGYPGATYEAYDDPRDSRIRGGRWTWKYNQLRQLFNMLVVYGDRQEPIAAWRELQKYKNKLGQACLRNIFQAIAFGGPITYYILAESGPILNAENSDKLRQE